MRIRSLILSSCSAIPISPLSANAKKPMTPRRNRTSPALYEATLRRLIEPTRLGGGLIARNMLPEGEGVLAPLLGEFQNKKYNGGAMDEEERSPDEQRQRPRVVDRRVSAGGTPRPRPETTKQITPPAQTAQPPPEQGRAEPPAPGTPSEDPAQAMAQEIARAPAQDWVVNACVTLINVAAVKLQINQRDEARLAIDALAGVLDAVGDRLGQDEAAVRQTLTQLRLAFAQGGQEPSQ
jgi:hypothetical protein